MTRAMKTVIERLKNDLMFATEYLNDPRSALQGYDLAREKYQALIARSNYYDFISRAYKVAQGVRPTVSELVTIFQEKGMKNPGSNAML